jgi:hypothetical protein
MRTYVFTYTPVANNFMDWGRFSKFLDKAIYEYRVVFLTENEEHIYISINKNDKTGHQIVNSLKMCGQEKSLILDMYRSNGSWEEKDPNLAILISYLSYKDKERLRK